MNAASIHPVSVESIAPGVQLSALSTRLFTRQPRRLVA
ncbi:hypothetical protein LUTEI9C_70450 [Luteimonas sp. 9C]|nr:hypothetical protein LUTEI9C_70450 [Luteimonas sp. 9C]